MFQDGSMKTISSVNLEYAKLLISFTISPEVAIKTDLFSNMPNMSLTSKTEGVDKKQVSVTKVHTNDVYDIPQSLA